MKALVGDTGTSPVSWTPSHAGSPRPPASPPAPQGQVNNVHLAVRRRLSKICTPGCCEQHRGRTDTLGPWDPQHLAPLHPCTGLPQAVT